MNNNDQFDAFSSHHHEVQQLEEMRACSSKAKQNGTRRYVRLDAEKEKLSFTSNKTRASPLKEIHQFILANVAMLNHEELDFFIQGGGNHLVEKKRGRFGFLYNKLTTAKNFVLNFGKTNSQLINEIQEKVVYQSIENQFNQNLEEGDLREIMNSMIFLKEQNKILETQTSKSGDLSFIKKIKQEIGDIKNQLLILQKQFQIKKNRKFIKIILKNITPAENDTPLVRRIKNRFLDEQKKYLDIMQSIHILFNPIAEVQIEEIIQSNESSQFQKIPIKTNFSNRFAKASNNISECHFRDPSDLSVRKFVRNYFKENGNQLTI